MYQNLSNGLNPNRAGMYPGQMAMGNYVMQQHPGMQQAPVAQPQQVPYQQYLRDNNAQDSLLSRLTYAHGLKPNQAQQLLQK